MTLVGGAGAYQQNYNSSQQPAAPAADIHDAIIMKLDASSSLNWFTFYGTDVGTNKDDEFWGVDVSGNHVYACGKAGGTNLPSAINTKVFTGIFPDGIITHFSTAGALNAGKYISGSIKNNSIKVYNGKVYTCGYGKSGGVPVNSGLYYYDGTCASGDFDAMFSVHDLDLSTTIHNTYLGGSAQDAAMDLQFSTNGVFYITGDTRSNNFPTTLVSNGYSSSYVNADDYFLSAFKEGVTGMVWSTYLGSQNDETDQAGECATIALDGQQFLHLGGTSNAYNTFPVDNNNGTSYFQPQRSGSPLGYSYDATITRFDLTSLNIVAGLKDSKASVSFGFYPNPTTKYLIVDNEELLNQNLKYTIYNISGQKLLDGTLNTNDRKTIDVASLNSGIYIINIGNDVKTFSNKFIKIDN